MNVDIYPALEKSLQELDRLKTEHNQYYTEETKKNLHDFLIRLSFLYE